MANKYQFFIHSRPENLALEGKDEKWPLSINRSRPRPLDRGSRRLIKTISTFFYVGCLPFIPGTFGSLAGLIIFYFIRANTAVYTLVTLAVIISGFLFSGRMERLLNKKDARCIVIDEVGGMLLSFAFLPYDFKTVVSVFFIFRLLDTFKPYPAGRLQDFKGSLGIMGDDIVAGLYTNIIVQIVLRLAHFKIS